MVKDMVRAISDPIRSVYIPTCGLWRIFISSVHGVSALYQSPVVLHRLGWSFAAQPLVDLTPAWVEAKKK
jgi:hypothetical protein